VYGSESKQHCNLSTFYTLRTLVPLNILDTFRRFSPSRNSGYQLPFLQTPYNLQKSYKNQDKTKNIWYSGF
jgi:hypothetical protein